MRRTQLPESSSRPSKRPISWRSARKTPHRADAEALRAVGVVRLPLAPKSRPRARSCPPAGTFGRHGLSRRSIEWVIAAPIYRMHGLTPLFRCSFLLAGPSAPRPHGPPPTYLLCTQVLRRTCSSYENARFYPTCARYLSHLCTVFIPPVHGLSGQSTAAGSTVRRSVPRRAGFPRPWPILRGCSWCEPTTPSGVHSRWSDAPCERGRS